MSYCRWSSDCFQCDVYVYESDCGFEIHVAVARHVSETPRPELKENPSVDDTVDYYMACLNWAKNAEVTAPIGLPFDGESFCFSTPKEAAEKLIEIKNAGYYVPQYAIDSLLEEASE